VRGELDHEFAENAVAENDGEGLGIVARTRMRLD